MSFLRMYARSTPRAFSQLTSTPIRSQSSLLRSTLRAPWKQSSVGRAAAAFHTSVPRFEVAGSEELVAKLDYEINHETSMRESDSGVSNNIQEYIDNSGFELQDVPGQEEVALVRTYGDETIKVTFSIADLNNPELQDPEEDMMMDEEDEDISDISGQSGGANTKGAINQGKGQDGNFKIAPEDSIAPADRPELDDEVAPEGGYPARLSIKIERAGKGALAFDAVASAGEITIESLYYFPKEDLAEPKTAEKDWERRSLYTGPQFGSLDEDLQLLFEKYLDERGINTRMALFIPDYIDFKEQKEYVDWLGNVKGYLE